MARQKQVPLRRSSKDNLSRRRFADGTLAKTPVVKRQQRTKHLLAARHGLDGIAKAALRRLAQKSGSIRVSGDTYLYMRRLLLSFCVTLVDDAIVYTKSNNRVTINAKDMLHGLNHMGFNLYGTPDLPGKRYTPYTSFSLDKKNYQGHNSGRKPRRSPSNSINKIYTIKTPYFVSHANGFCRKFFEWGKKCCK